MYILSSCTFLVAACPNKNIYFYSYSILYFHYLGKTPSGVLFIQSEVKFSRLEAEKKILWAIDSFENEKSDLW